MNVTLVQDMPGSDRFAIRSRDVQVLCLISLVISSFVIALTSALDHMLLGWLG